MKSFFTILKLVLLAALLVALGIGYLFFRVWQKNERPTVESSEWTTEEILLGYDSTLEVTISAPWHREITKATPNSHPEFLVPVPDKATVTRGQLGLDGMRTWKLTVPFVSTNTGNLEGLTASFPVKATKRVSPNSVTLPLPPLTISSPAEVPETPQDPGMFLTEEKPEEVTSSQPEAGKPPSPWLWALPGLLLIPVIIYLLRRSGVFKSTPPWEKALGKLNQLDPKTQPVAFYSKLTDILKQYTSERYSVRARAKTSTEFIQALHDLPHIPNEYLNELPAFARLADAVKFADHVPDSNHAPESLELIRSFVTATTPEQTSDSDDV